MNMAPKEECAESGQTMGARGNQKKDILKFRYGAEERRVATIHMRGKAIGRCGSE